MAQIGNMLVEFAQWLRERDHNNGMGDYCPLGQGYEPTGLVTEFLEHIGHNEWMPTTGEDLDDPTPYPTEAGSGVLPSSPETDTAVLREQVAKIAWEAATPRSAKWEDFKATTPVISQRYYRIADALGVSGLLADPNHVCQPETIITKPEPVLYLGDGKPVMSTADTLLAFSEWLDGENVCYSEPEAHTFNREGVEYTHDDLAKQFIGWWYGSERGAHLAGWGRGPLAVPEPKPNDGEVDLMPVLQALVDIVTSRDTEETVDRMRAASLLLAWADVNPA